MNASVLPKIDPAVKLPPRMEEIVDQVAKGFPTKTVADMFGISRRTVEAEVSRAKHMTGARNIVELAWYFICRDLNVRLVIEDGKRKILTAIETVQDNGRTILTTIILLFVVNLEFTDKADLRTRIRKGKRDEYECVNECFDRPINTFVAIAEGTTKYR